MIARRGHTSFFFGLFVLQVIWVLVMILVRAYCWGQNTPRWFEWVELICSPGGLFLCLAVGVWAFISIESLASITGCAVWTYTREPYFCRLPWWFWARFFIFSGAVVCTASTLGLMYSGWKEIVKFSFWQWNKVGLVTMGYAVGIAVVAGLVKFIQLKRSGKPFEEIMLATLPGESIK